MKEELTGNGLHREDMMNIKNNVSAELCVHIQLKLDIRPILVFKLGMSLTFDQLLSAHCVL